MKTKLTQAPVLSLTCFDKVFQIECNASRLGICGMLTQEGRPPAFFNEKLYSRRKYSTHDKKFYTIMQFFFKQWSHYLMANKFIFHSDIDALKYIQGQQKLNSRHAKSVQYLQSF